MPAGGLCAGKGRKNVNYKWARGFTLELINQYSIAGVDIPDSYNNQADYIKRIPKLLDDGQMYIATTSGHIRAVTALKSLSRTELGGWWVYRLPRDCWQVCGGLLRSDGPALHRYHKHRMVGDNGIAVPKELDGELVLEYYRYPMLLGDDPREDAELDNTAEAQMALPYYAAAHLVMQDNAFAYASLYNEFEAKLARLGKNAQAEVGIVEDAYCVEY